jgi:Fur family ferric uptake transcriptional regulator
MKLPFLSFLHKKAAKSTAPAAENKVEHRLDREQFQTVLQSFQATRVADRLLVLDAFLSVERHVTIFELAEIISARHPELLDEAFLQETMGMFCRFGFARRLNFENKETLYEHLHLGKHHDHLICTKCGLIQEFHDDVLEDRQLIIADQYDFHPLQHKTEIYGFCAKCLALRQPSLPLYMAAMGEKVKITGIAGGSEVKRRLNDLGLLVGAEIEVVSSNPAGPQVVIVNGSRLALGAGVARKVMVSHAGHRRDVDKAEG